jgi:hypothetical protein
MGGDGRLSPPSDWGDPRFVDRVRALFHSVVKVDVLIYALKLVRTCPKDEHLDRLLSLVDDVDTFLNDHGRMDVTFTDELNGRRGRLVDDCSTTNQRRRTWTT